MNGSVVATRSGESAAFSRLGLGCVLNLRCGSVGLLLTYRSAAERQHRQYHCEERCDDYASGSESHDGCPRWLWRSKNTEPVCPAQAHRFQITRGTNCRPL